MINEPTTQQDPTRAEPSGAPSTEAEVYAQAENKASLGKRELSEMRLIGARLEDLPPPSRRRVLGWLNDHYLAP